MVVSATHSALHAATAQLHHEIDAQFSGFDLGERDGVTRFLSAHAIAMRACQPRLTRFARHALGCAAPDYAKMLKHDLAVLGVDSARLPRAMLPAAIADAGVFYVVAGSRLGAAVLRERATAIIPGGMATEVCSYFAKDQGPAMWRLFREWLAQPQSDGDATSASSQAIVAAATATFHVFAHAAKLADGTVPTMKLAADTMGSTKDSQPRAGGTACP